MITDRQIFCYFHCCDHSSSILNELKLNAEKSMNKACLNRNHEILAVFKLNRLND